ncbi:MAG: hypothetical protein ABR97_14295 [Rhodobacter sp. BACL10 MAG-120419-bin15]|nr:MAG: hypothetical protein ABR97_14295 [Rhodobacter sp. BACL10 MAG-120419-bin15]
MVNSASQHLAFSCSLWGCCLGAVAVVRLRASMAPVFVQPAAVCICLCGKCHHRGYLDYAHRGVVISCQLL